MNAEAISKEMCVDLHLHTYFSDGASSPEEVIRMACVRGLSAIALTDHDTTDGVERGILAGARYGVEVIPAIELSTKGLAAGHDEIHILGYYINWRTVYFQKKLALFRGARLKRAHAICDKLNDLGIPVDRRIIFEMEGQGSVGRMHIAKALFSGGYVKDLDEAFSKYLIRGKPAFVERIRFLPEEAIDMIRNIGGIPVLAHPKFGVPTKKIAKYLVRKGLQGIEAHYLGHTEDETKKYLSWAEEMNLLVTGGSDSHGELPGRPEAIGRQYVPYTSVVKMKEFKYMMMRRNMRLFEEV
ncbi:MAG: PHP domain-containing protein [Elusimicrobiota bacterium]|nr:PHP domain-containing protein [Elusimicrobiota bacterium]